MDFSLESYVLRNVCLSGAFSDFFKAGSSTKAPSALASEKVAAREKSQRDNGEDSDESDECDKTINDILNECLGNEPELREHWAKLNESCKKAGKMPIFVDLINSHCKIT